VCLQRFVFCDSVRDWICICVGGMQDYNYIFAGCLELTLEISCCKFPTNQTLLSHWQRNRDALILYLVQAHLGTSYLWIHFSYLFYIYTTIIRLSGFCPGQAG